MNAEESELFGHDTATGRIGVGEQDPESAQNIHRNSGLILFPEHRKVKPDSYPELRAFSQFAFDADGSFHHSGQLLAYGQAESGSAKTAGNGGVNLGEYIEKSVDFIFRDADAGVFYGEAQRDFLFPVGMRVVGG